MTRPVHILLCLIAATGYGQIAAIPPPTALVTFYSSGSFWKTAIPGYKYGSFAGRVFDEYDQLAAISPGQFVTFRLDAGPHTFSAGPWIVPRPEAGSHLAIDLVANQHYYIGTYLETTPLVVLFKLRMDQRTCQEAEKDNVDTKPLGHRHLMKYGSKTVVQETTFPLCS